MIFIKYSLLSLMICSTILAKRHRNIETTRMISTSGAGVASLLVSEASILNPSVLVFYSDTEVYIQKNSIELENPNVERIGSFEKKSNYFYSMTDTSSSYKGSLSYNKLATSDYSTKQINLSFSRSMGKKAAFGMIYHYILDYNNGTQVVKKEHTTSLGFSYIHTPNLIFGLVYNDVLKKINNNQKATIGLQYNFNNFLLLMLDHGFHYGYNYRENSFSKIAVQTSLYKDVYLRAGAFQNKYLSLEGFSYGAAWIGPKLSFQYGYRKSTHIEENIVVFENEEIIEHSFSMALRF